MQYKTITSLSNRHIGEALEIRERTNHGSNTFLIESPHLIEMALAAGSHIIKVFFTPAFSAGENSQRLLSLLRRNSAEVFETTERILNKLADTVTPQGIIAIVSHDCCTFEKFAFKNPPLIVAVDGIQDPGNLGTIIRTADASGADGIIIFPETCDAFMNKAIRATAGSIFNIPIIYSEYDAFFEWAEKSLVTIFATDINAQKSLFESDLSKPLAFVFGNEAHGVSKRLANKADLLVKIPIFGRAESLNVAASAAVCLYEAARQRIMRS